MSLPNCLVSRGVSSVVRRCVHKHTGQEFAVKIIEITAEKMTEQQLEEVKSSTLKEIHVLTVVKGHPSISESECYCLKWCVQPFLSSNWPYLCFFSHTYWFLWVNNLHIFGIRPVSILYIIILYLHWKFQTKFTHNFSYSMRRGELFDYLTEKVTLSEKETRWVFFLKSCLKFLWLQIFLLVLYFGCKCSYF